MTGKKTSFSRRFLAGPGESASEGVIKSLKTLFPSDTSQNAIPGAAVRQLPDRRLFPTAEILRLTPFCRRGVLESIFVKIEELIDRVR